MGLFNREPSFEDLSRNYEKAKFNHDCSQSISVIIDLKKNLEAIQCFIERGDQETALFVTRKCCDNPIIAYNKENLPFVGLTSIQEDILSEIYNINPNFASDPMNGLFHVARNNMLSRVVQACNTAQKKIENARAGY